tara:strand:+ start:921 stop:1079 length:159 start_codon:yes stop_codon:yes gene_type:complete
LCKKIKEKKNKERRKKGERPEEKRKRKKREPYLGIEPRVFRLEGGRDIQFRQ